MSDITLSVAPLVEHLSAVVTNPAERILVTVAPPAAAPLTLSTAAPLPPVRLELVQSVPRILLTVGPQIGIPGAACLPDSRSCPVFTYENGRLTRIAYADGSTKAFAYDDAHRLATLTDTAGGVPRTRTFHYDPDNNLVSIT